MLSLQSNYYKSLHAGSVLHYVALHYINNVIKRCWLGPWAGNIIQILHCDWLLQQATWLFLATQGCSLWSTRNTIFFFILNNNNYSYIDHSYIDQLNALFLCVYGPGLCYGLWTYKKGSWLIYSAILASCLVIFPYLFYGKVVLR